MLYGMTREKNVALDFFSPVILVLDTSIHYNKESIFRWTLVSVHESDNKYINGHSGLDLESNIQ